MSKGVVVFVEGDTEDEIYKKFISYIKRKENEVRFDVDKLVVRNLKGVGNFKHRAIRVFEKDIIKKYPDIEFYVYLCYDSDVFDDFSIKPPVDWIDLEKALKTSGAKKVVHVKAKKSIEDWILRDSKGLYSFLRLPKDTKLNGSNGLEKIKNLFKKASKVYVKGSQIKGFVDVLDIEIIICGSCREIGSLCKLLGVDCERCK